MADSSLFVSCWGTDNFRDTEIMFVADTPDFTKLNQTDGGSSNDWAASLATGPGTWAIAYSDASYAGNALYLNPNTAYADLNDAPGAKGAFGQKTLSSLKIYNARPADWPGPSQPAGSPALWRGTLLSDLGRASVNRDIKRFCSKALGKVPTFGLALSLLVNLVWPSDKPSDEQVWEGIQNWVESLVADLGIAVENKLDQDQIVGACNLLVRLNDGVTAGVKTQEQDFAFLFNSLIGVNLPYFTNLSAQAAAGALDKIVLYGTIALAVLRMGWLNAADIYGDAKVGDLNRKWITTYIPKLRATVFAGIAEAKARRLAQVKAAADDNIVTADNAYCVDPYLQTYTGGSRNPPDAANDVVYYQKNYAGPTFDALFAPYEEIANFWTYFDQPGNPEGDFQPLTATTTVKMGAWGGNGMSLSGNWSDPGYQGDATCLFFDFEAPARHWVSNLTLYDTVGLSISFTDGAKVTTQNAGNRSKPDHTLSYDLDGAGKAIVAVFGAWDDKIKSLQVRTNFPHVDYFDKVDGFYDTGLHVGGDDGKGGSTFLSNGPDASDAVLSGVFGYTNADGGDQAPICALGFYWTYDKVQPRAGYAD